MANILITNIITMTTVMAMTTEVATAIESIKGEL